MTSHSGGVYVIVGKGARHGGSVRVGLSFDFRSKIRFRIDKKPFTPGWLVLAAGKMGSWEVTSPRLAYHHVSLHQ
jgi:hypothetical protein